MSPLNPGVVALCLVVTVFISLACCVLAALPGALPSGLLELPM